MYYEVQLIMRGRQVRNRCDGGPQLRSENDFRGQRLDTLSLTTVCRGRSGLSRRRANVRRRIVVPVLRIPPNHSLNRQCRAAHWLSWVGDTQFEAYRL